MPQNTKEEKAAYWKSYYENNKEKLLQKNKEYHARSNSEEKKKLKASKMRDRYRLKKEEILIKSCERIKERRKADPEFRKKEKNRRDARSEKLGKALVEYRSDYYQRNKERIKLKTREWRKNNKRCSTPMSCIAHRCRATIQSVIRRRGWKKNCKTNEMLGCDWLTLKLHLEHSFLKGMNWENRHLWHIDHYKPLATAKSTEDVIKLSHYTNLRPMWKHDNLKKSAKLCHKGHQLPLLLQ